MKSLLKIRFLFILFLISNLSFSQVSFERIDPPSWWVGMEDPSLQLMVHGTNVAQAGIIVNYPGVILKKASRVENPNYLVIDLEVTKDALPGIVPIVFEYQREVLFTIDYPLKKREVGSRERTGFGKDDVIYLLMPDRFSNGDTGNDTVPGMLEAADRANLNGRHGGDIRGIRNKLDFLDSLGITALWLNPVQENNMAVYSYHGYAITDFYRVDPRFGDNLDYRMLVDECHKKGMKVIMDMVFNHCGSNHFWMHDMPMSSWIHQFPEFTKSNFRSETTMDPYVSDYDRERMLTGWFDRNMPDLNQHNEILANYLIQNSIWWIEFAGLDGIRMDTYPYSYPDVMARWMQRVMLEYPNFNVVGETWQQRASQTAYWQSGSPAAVGYESHLKSVTDFPMQYALRDAFTEEEGWTSGLAKLYYLLAQDFLFSDPYCNVIFADNHDMTRFYTSINEDYSVFKMAMAVLLTTRGIPAIYYGTEYLMTGKEPDGHGYIRQDFPGGEWKDGGHRSSVTGQQLVDSLHGDEAVLYLQTLLNWRKSSEVIHNGKLKQFIPMDGIYVYFRYNVYGAVMVAVNKNKDEKPLDLEKYAEVLKDYAAAKDVVSGKEYMLTDGLVLPAKTALVMELE